MSLNYVYIYLNFYMFSCFSALLRQPTNPVRMFPKDYRQLNESSRLDDVTVCAVTTHCRHKQNTKNFQMARN